MMKEEKKMIKLVAVGGVEDQWPLYFSDVQELQEYVRRFLNELILNNELSHLQDIGEVATRFAQFEQSGEIRDCLKLMTLIDNKLGISREWKRLVV